MTHFRENPHAEPPSERRVDPSSRESEERIREKLESLFRSGDPPGELALSDLIDSREIQSLMEDFYALTHLPMAIVDLKGKILVGVGLQEVCTRFHRKHPESLKHCMTSDTQLSAGVPLGEFKLYKCRNEMWDVSTPIVVGGRHVGNVFTGQFFFEGEALDYDRFRSQARRYGFDEETYIAALEAVPRLSRETVDTGMAFLTKFAHILSQLGYGNLELARSLAQRRCLAAVVEHSNDFIGICTPEMEPFFVNEAGRRMVGLDTMEEALRTPVMEYFWPEDRALIESQGIPALLREGRWSGEVRFKHFKTGEPIHTLWSAFVIRDETGKPVAWATISPDLNNVKSLEAAKSAAEEASRAKSEFMANMSHEIRTPMTIFMAAVEYLLESEEAPERRELLEMAGQSAERLQVLLDDILDFSRIEAQRMNLLQDDFDPRACVRDAVSLLKISARKKGLYLETEVAPDVPQSVSGDPDRLGQVLVNLIGNAVKFTDRGGVKVDVRRRGDTLHFSVSDTGIGIPESKMGLLFQSFSQVDSSLTRKFGGTGLGLAICRGLLELMGGEITARSREGEGSVFSFTLPLSVPQEAEAPSPEGRAPRILLVEDDPAVREIVRMLLEKRGWNPELAESGREAISKWQDGEFDLILMDLQMPDVDGLDAVGMIREGETGGERRVPIVALTAHARREVQEECLAGGFDAFLTKPIDTETLYATIERALKGSAPGR